MTSVDRAVNISYIAGRVWTGGDLPPGCNLSLP
jgi:hypothetical protein